MNKAIIEKTVSELAEEIKNREASSEEITSAFVESIKKQDEILGAFLMSQTDEALSAAKDFDKNIDTLDTNQLAGIPYVLKDNIVTSGIRTTAASKILENFVPPYDATVYERLKDCHGILLGKVNMDEFAMGSSTENSAYQKTKNPWNLDCVPGGSSGGSAVAVASMMSPYALGSDTGGSIRQPAAYTGLVGLKPTYGLVSRYGLIAFASSLDQIGTFTHTVKDAAIVLEKIAGKDKRDSTSIQTKIPHYVEEINQGVAGKTIAISDTFTGDQLQPDIRKAFEEAIKIYEKLGAKFVNVKFSLLEQALSAYYMIASAEASSNLARYDGVRYGVRASDYDGLVDMYYKTRTQGFGDEVKRRIMLGTYALSSGYYDAFYKKAMQVRTLIVEEFNRIFEQADLLFSPTTATTAFKFGERLDNPLEMYLSDIFTIPANISGLPAVSIPAGLDKSGLPIGLQLTGPALSEASILNAANAYELETGYQDLRAPLH